MHSQILRIRASERSRLRSDLEAIWEATFSEAVGEIQDDLERMMRWFGPEAKPSGIRKLLRAAAEVEAESELLLRVDPPLALSYGGRFFLTLEGRWVLETLRGSEPGDVVVDLHDPQITERYRDWAQQTSREVVAAWSGETSQTRAPAIGVVTLLLMLDAVGPRRALKLGKSMGPEAARELKRIIRDFTASIGTPSGFKEEVWGYPLSVAGARFFGLFREGEKVWINNEQYEATLLGLAAELSAPKRAIQPSQAILAVKVLINAYERHSSLFARAGLLPLRRDRAMSTVAQLRRLLEVRPA